MIQSLIPKKPKKGPIELQLTALIDVFSMIVIFLILGGVMGAPDIVVPKDMKVPKSSSKEGIESAPRLTIEKDQVLFSLSPNPIPMSEFSSFGARDRMVSQLESVAAEYLKKQKEAKSPVTALNLVADRDTPYKSIFDVIVVFRRIGFSSILFVATGEPGGKK